MAKRKDKHEERLMVDEKVIAHIGDFFSQHSTKFVLIFVVVMAIVVVWVVNAYASRSHEKEVGNYLEDNLFAPLGMHEPQPFPRGLPNDEVKLNVDEILEKIEGSKIRPYVLALLSHHLFRLGGNANLRRAEEIARTLRDEYQDPRWAWYQKRADRLLNKIKDERAFQLPEPFEFGPQVPEAETEKAPETDEPETPEPPDTQPGPAETDQQPTDTDKRAPAAAEQPAAKPTDAPPPAEQPAEPAEPDAPPPAEIPAEAEGEPQQSEPVENPGASSEQAPPSGREGGAPGG
jgi:hypothetical protein